MEGSKPFLTSRIPNLSFDRFVIDNKRFSLELNTDGCFRINTKFVPSEPSKQLSFSNGGITDQHDFENIIDLLVVISIQIRHIDRSVTFLFTNKNGYNKHADNCRSRQIIVDHDVKSLGFVLRT